MVGSTLGVYSFGLIFVSARTNKRHHHLWTRRRRGRALAEFNAGDLNSALNLKFNDDI